MDHILFGLALDIIIYIIRNPGRCLTKSLVASSISLSPIGKALNESIGQFVMYKISKFNVLTKSYLKRQAT